MFRKKILKDVASRDFGSYQEMVESFIYEIERSRSNLNKQKRLYKNKQILNLIKFLYVFMSLVVCPTILILMAYFTNKGIFMEYIFYTAWVVMGIFLSHNPFKILVNNNKDISIKISNLQSSFLWGIKYAQVVSDSFFLKKNEIENILKNITGNELQELSRNLSELEIDLSLFEEIAYRSERCNEEPLILPKDYYHDGRDFAQHYLSLYYNKNLESSSI